MKKTLLIPILFLTLSLFAQESNYLIPLKTLQTTPEAGEEESIAKQLRENASKSENSVFIMQFYKIPGPQERKALKESGFEILGYIGGHAYYVRYRKNAGTAREEMLTGQIRALIPLSAGLKIEPRLMARPLPDYMISGKRISVYASYFKDCRIEEAQRELERKGWEIIRHSELGQLFEIQVPPEELEELAALPWVQYIEGIGEPGTPENYTAAISGQASLLNGLSHSGLSFTGKGIRVQLQDDGIIGPHADYKNRIVKQFPNNNFGNHGDHTGGTIMGAGNIDPKGRGMAPGVELVVYNYEPMNDSILKHHDRYGIVISSTSYSNGCNDGYTATAKAQDRSINLFPDLMHVFSAGNSNNSNCGYGAGTQWGNITGGHKVAKNVITVANVNDLGFINNSSSRGPSSDGRIKPDISAKGTNVYSTVNPDSYELKTGTSMSCPAVSGSLALLYEAYKSSHNGANPPSALIKCHVLNSARDLGKKGPDFIYGWGLINNYAAARLILDDAYFSDSVGQGESREFQINVAAGKAEARFMLYWHDLAANAGVSKALINDLDLIVITPAGDTVLPYVLSTAANSDSLNKAARHGIDHLNNMEQVFIDLPQPGNYRLIVKGFEVPLNRQEFYISYYLPDRGITLIYPRGGESVDEESFASYISWENFSKSNDPVKLYYSADSGQNWNLISAAASPTAFAYYWVLPAGISGPVKVRVESGPYMDESPEFFAVLPTPSNIRIEKACCENLFLRWDAIAGVDSYRVYILDSLYMSVAGNSTSNQFLIERPGAYKENWVSVSAMKDGMEGPRAVAVKKEEGTFLCDIDSNLTLGQILSPGRELISSCLYGDSLPVILELNNYSNSDLSSPLLYYEYNGRIVEYKSNVIIPAGSSKTITFPGRIALPLPGVNTLKAWISFPADRNNCDDTLEVQYQSQGSTLVTAPYRDDLESNFPCGIAPNCGFTVCDLNKGLVNAPNGVIDDIDWRIDISGTSTVGTGPSMDHNPGTGIGRYLYLEASGECSYQQASLYLPCFDLNGLQNPKLSFWYHMFGADIGTLEILINDGSGWLSLKKYYGNQGNFWHEHVLDLSPWKGKNVVVKIIGITGGGFASDIALDDFKLYDDVALEAEIVSNDSVCLSREHEFRVDINTRVKRIEWNFGPDAIPQTVSGTYIANVRYMSKGKKKVTVKVVRIEDSLTVTKNINVIDTPVALFEILPIGKGAIQLLNHSVHATTYEWKLGILDSSRLKEPVFTLSGPDPVSVWLFAGNSACVSYTSLNLTPLEWYFEDSQMILYPNPADKNSRLLLVNPKLSDLRIELVSSDGRKLWDAPIEAISENQYEIDTSKLPAGIYLVKLSSGEDSFVNKLIVIHQ